MFRICGGWCLIHNCPPESVPMPLMEVQIVSSNRKGDIHMKRDWRKVYPVDMEIISDRDAGNLAAAQVEFCVDKLEAAVGNHGGVDYITDDHNYHDVYVFATSRADMIGIMQVVSFMYKHGCLVILCGGNSHPTMLDFEQQLHEIDPLW